MLLVNISPPAPVFCSCGYAGSPIGFGKPERRFDGKLADA